LTDEHARGVFVMQCVLGRHVGLNSICVCVCVCVCARMCVCVEIPGEVQRSDWRHSGTSSGPVGRGRSHHSRSADCHGCARYVSFVRWAFS